MDVTDWRKSSYSGGNGGECVEVASADGVMVRDTTDRDGVTLSVPADVWRTFADELKRRCGQDQPPVAPFHAEAGGSSPAGSPFPSDHLSCELRRGNGLPLCPEVGRFPYAEVPAGGLWCRRGSADNG